MNLAGKGMYIWQLPRIAGGNVDIMAKKAVDAQLTHVLIKIADGEDPYNAELADPATEAFKAAGIQVWGWAWLWMTDPVEEAKLAARSCKKLNLDGFVINAEHPAKGKPQEAEAYMAALRQRLPDFTIGLSSYRYPQHHTTLPWSTFLQGCDLDMPQTYWVGERPADCLYYSLQRHAALNPARPVIPTGSAYGEQYGSSYFRAQPEEITAFLDAVRSHDLPAANFWSWDWTEAHAPDLWKAIADYEWPLPEGEPLDLAEQFWQALTENDLEALKLLYHDNALYVTAARSAQGPEPICERFAALYERFPNLVFTQDDLQVEGNIRFLYWHAESDAGRLVSGLDTIGLRAGKIQYHASSYQVVAA